MVDRSDLIDAQVEQKFGASTASSGKGEKDLDSLMGEKDLDSLMPGLDSRAGYAHLSMVPVRKLFQTPPFLYSSSRTTVYILLVLWNEY